MALPSMSLGSLTMHLRLAMRVEDLQQPLAHQEPRLVRGHVALDAVVRIDADIVLRRFEDRPALIHNRPVPGDEFCRGAVRLGVVAIEPLAQLHGPVVDRRRTIHDDVLAPTGIGRVKDPCERQEPLVSEMPRRDGMGVARDPHGVRGIVHRHDGFGVKPPRGGPQGVLS